MQGEFKLEDVVGMLAQALGLEKATEVVGTAARALGYGRSNMSQNDAATLLEKIGEEPGLIGLTATLAKSRLHFGRAAASLNATLA